MTSSALIKKINQLKKSKQAIILVHNYQRPEIYQVADFIGDSLELARQAAKTKAKIIIFCGVDFMAESAKILNPKKKVILPDLTAKCPMAATVKIDGLIALQKQHPNAKTVSYVNTTAETKAVSDICCTSANAVEIVKNIRGKEIIFVPDQHLAAYVQSKLLNKKIIPWIGSCCVHAGITPEKIMAEKKLHPKSEVIIHPECRLSAIKLADQVASTSGMINYTKQSPKKEFIIATESGMIYRLREEVKNKKFYPVGGICGAMKKITLDKVLQALENESPEIKIDEIIRKKAEKALKKMIH